MGWGVAILLVKLFPWRPAAGVASSACQPAGLRRPQVPAHCLLLLRPLTAPPLWSHTTHQTHPYCPFLLEMLFSHSVGRSVGRQRVPGTRSGLGPSTGVGRCSGWGQAKGTQGQDQRGTKVMMSQNRVADHFQAQRMTRTWL